MRLQIKTWALFLDLEIGVMFMSVSFMTMSFIIMIVNLTQNPEINYDYQYNDKVYIYVLIILLTWFVAFIGAYLKNRHVIFATIVLWTLFIVIWLSAVILSHFFTKFASLLCIDKRCAVSLWLFTNRHYDIFHDKIEYFYHVAHEPPKDVPVIDPFEMYNAPEYEIMEPITQKDMHHTELIIAILLFATCFISTIFLQFSGWILLYSYYKQLQCYQLFISCDKVCKEEPPEIIVALNKL